MKIPHIESLVSYKTPPLREVAIAIQFQPIQLDLDAIISLRSAFKVKFPNVEQKPPLQARFELYDDVPAVSEMNIQFVDGIPDRRYWFVADDQENLIQIQPDRFIRNWRKRQSDGSYPRAETIIPAFVEDFSKFVEVLDGRSQDVSANQIEVSYFNDFPVSAGESFFEAVPRYLTIFDAQFRNTTVSDLGFREDASRLTLTYIFEEKATQSKGRVHVDVVPALDGNGNRILRLQLIARGRPGSIEEDTIAEFVLLARNNIVKMFEAITSDAAKSAWGRGD